MASVGTWWLLRLNGFQCTLLDVKRMLYPLPSRRICSSRSLRWHPRTSLSLRYYYMLSNCVAEAIHDKAKILVTVAGADASARVRNRNHRYHLWWIAIGAVIGMVVAPFVVLLLLRLFGLRYSAYSNTMSRGTNKRSTYCWIRLLPASRHACGHIGAGRDVIRGAVKRLADAVAGQMHRPARDFHLALLMFFDFHGLRFGD